MSAVDRLDALLAELAEDPPERVLAGWHRALACQELAPEVLAAPAQREWVGARLRVGLRSRVCVRFRMGARRVGAAGAALGVAAALLLLAGPVTPGWVQPSRTASRPVVEQPFMLRELEPGAGAPPMDLARQAGCLARVGVPGARVLASAHARWHGRLAVRLVLATSVPGQLRVLTVTADCGPDAGQLLQDR